MVVGDGVSFMGFTNGTPFSAELFRQFNLAGLLNGVVAVRGTFDLVPEQTLVLSTEQAPFQWSDEYAGDPHETHLVIPADFVPFKPGTDVTVLGISHAPDREKLLSWTCGVRVGNRVKKLLKVHGPRQWKPQIRAARPSLAGRESDPQFQGWALTPGEAVSSVPISWHHAFGGPKPLRPGQVPPAEVHPNNGIGPGLLDPHHSPLDRPLTAPQVEAPDDPILDWRADHVPQGFAPVPPWWQFRLQYAGTYDERWIAERHPVLPADFDFKFWQCAHPDLIADPWLNGDETVEFAHMHPEMALLRTRLPGVSLQATLRRERQKPERFPLQLDGVHFDFRLGASKAFLTWRGSFPYEVQDADVELSFTADMVANPGWL